MHYYKKFTNSKIDLLVIGLILVLIQTTMKAQLFEENELYPKVTMIKGKYYNGTGGRGYWSKDYLDSLGRVIIKESYFKEQLMLRQIREFDSHNNKLIDIQTFDFNNPQRVDTFRFEYKYSVNQIIYQYRKLSDIDSTVIELMKNEGDSILRYQEKAFYYQPKEGKTYVYETNYTLKYRNGLLYSNEVYNKENDSKEIKKYEYYGNGRLKRRIIEWIPKPEGESFNVGGPGSDDEFYKYKLDSNGRIIKFYKIINGKKFKIAVYKYE